MAHSRPIRGARRTKGTCKWRRWRWKIEAESRYQHPKRFGWPALRLRLAGVADSREREHKRRRTDRQFAFVSSLRSCRRRRAPGVCCGSVKETA
jgi:hypothetical protein